MNENIQESFKFKSNIKIIENTLSDQDKNYKNSLRKLKI